MPSERGGRAAIFPAGALDPARVVLPDGGTPDARAWRREAGRADGLTLIAALPAGDRWRVCGELTLSLRPGGRGSLDRVYVAPAARRLGVGTALVRAALRHARAAGLATLEEYIPNLYAVTGGAVTRYEPIGAELGGVRSLGTAARACAAERQVCRVARIARAWHTGEWGREGRIGAALEMPLAAPLAPPRTGDARLADLEAAIVAEIYATIGAASLAAL
ncbi:MAG TPA: GNAT family N-acetyltransferase [Thermomicrobiales bacterium]|nr:GNAT family N-acetyltransferase [Thermomicrobiales bacterium]